MPTIIIIQSLFILFTMTNSERLLYPLYCYDHESYIILSFSANFSYENFRKYLIDFSETSDCIDDNRQTYLYDSRNLNPNGFVCNSPHSKRECIHQFLSNETFAYQIYTLTKNMNGDILQIDDTTRRLEYMQGAVKRMTDLKKESKFFYKCYSFVLITDFAVTTFMNKSTDFSDALNNGVNLYLFTNENAIREYFPTYWNRLDSSNINNSAFCDPLPNVIKTEPPSKSLHIYLAIRKSTENSAIFIQRIYEFIDTIISKRINMSINSECAVIDSEHVYVFRQYLTVYIHQNSSHSVGFESYWQNSLTAINIKRQIQQHYSQLFSEENIDTTIESNDQFFIDIENDSLSMLTNSNSSHYSLLITNIISTYITKSTKFNNFLRNTTISKNYDIIFIDDVKKSVDVSAYQHILPATQRSPHHFYYIDNDGRLANLLDTLTFCADTTASKSLMPTSSKSTSLIPIDKNNHSHIIIILIIVVPLSIYTIILFIVYFYLRGILKTNRQKSIDRFVVGGIYR